MKFTDANERIGRIHIPKQFIRAMRTIVIIITTCLMQVSASTKAQISLNEKKATLEAILTNIKKQTGTNFLYNIYSLKESRPVTVKVKNASLPEVLKICFENQPFSYKIENNTVIIVVPKNSQRENPELSFIKITGSVKDAAGLSLPGVSVLNKTTGKVVATDTNGIFSIDANEGDILAFSSVGFTKQEVRIGTQDKLDIVLLEQKNELEQVVVTALGITKNQRKLGYAVSTVNGNLLNQAKEPNVASSLEGRVAGLNINSASGGPGSSARILIRGVSSFSSDNVGPLIVIDGVPMDNTQRGTPGSYGGSDQGDGISSINPDDIESITVLKGSTASALYGARSSNGVILITTKSGKGTKGMGIEVSSNFYLNQVVNLTDFQKEYGAGQHGVIPQTVGDLINNDGFNSWGPKFAGQQAVGFDGKMYPYEPVSNPWKQFYKTALVTSNNVSLSHGGENGNVRFSLSQTDNPSVMPNSGLNRYSGNLNLNQNIGNKLKLTMMANFVNENVKNRPYLNDFVKNSNFTIEWLPSNISPNSLKPGFDPVTGKEMLIDGSGYYANPWFVQNKIVNNTTRNRFISSTALRYDFTKELYAMTRLGLDYIIDNSLQINATGWGVNTRGSLGNQSKQETTELNIDGLIGYTHNFSDNFNMDATVGGSIRKNKPENIGYYNQGWIIPFVYTVTNSDGLASNYFYSKLQTNSLYYSLDFNFARYLTLSTTGRADWYSTVLDNPIFTPSVSTSFLFNSLLHIPKMNLGKLRASYAQTSQGAIPYRTQITYQSQGAISANGNNYAYGFPQSFVFNPNDIRAYKMKEYEIGLETKFFERRLGFNLTYFNRKTQKELVSQPIDPASGFSSAYFPLGSTSNHGVELELSGTPILTKNFTWNTDFNFTTVANKLESLGDASGVYIMLNQYDPATGGTTNAGDGSFIANVQGLPLSQIMVFDYKRDANGNIIVANGIPVRGNLIPTGSGIPKIYGGINNELNYKRFSLGFLVDYRFKAKVLSATNFESLYYGLNKETLAGRETGITFNGVNEDGSRNTTNVDAQTYYQGLLNNGIGTMQVFDASFIKLRQVTLGYDFPLVKATRNAIQSVRVSLVGRNLWTILKHTPNFDPESQYSSALNNAGLEGGSLPPVRTYGINLNIKF